MRRFSLVLLLLAACGSPTEPNFPTLVFENGVVFGIPTLPVSAAGGTGAIVVSGVIQTDGGGYTLFADLHPGPGNEPTLQIDVYLTGPGFQFLTQNFYRARLQSLAPGDYDLSVVHVRHDPAPVRRERVYHQTVHVD